MDTAWDLLAFPRLCGLIARKPTRLSQEMHNAGFKALGLPFCYVAFDIEDTSAALQAMRKMGFRGLSLTIPHKENAIPLLDSIDPTAKTIGAVNTVINDGRELRGYNTDWIGIRDALGEAKIELKGKRALIYGAGGASRAAILALQTLECAEILLCNRSAQRAEALAKEFKTKIVLESALPELAASGGVDLVVNSTPIGSKLESGLNPLTVFFTDVFTKSRPALFEMVTRETPLEKAARAAAVKVVPGSRMLLFQALEQFRLFTTHQAPTAILDAALQTALIQRGSNS